MPVIVAQRLIATCPTCQVPQSLTAAHRGPEGESSEPVRAALLECTRCWQRRARVLNATREGLRQSGELTCGDGRWTWQGEVLGDLHEHDGLEGAMASALLRHGLPLAPGSRLTLPAVEPEPNVVGSRALR